MGHLVLMNDVETEAHAAGLIAYNTHATLTKTGSGQCVKVAEYLHKRVKHIDVICCTNADHLKKLVHHIRSKSPNKNILKKSPVYTESLNERNFGVLSGSRFSLDSDLFNHTRICAEKGESVAQCRRRVMKFISGICAKYPKGTILAVSHSFTCQIVSNVLLNKNHTVLSEFWMKKCSLAKYNYKTDGATISRWRFVNACNAIDDREYSEKELYNRLFEKQGSSSG